MHGMGRWVDGWMDSPILFTDICQFYFVPVLLTGHPAIFRTCGPTILYQLPFFRYKAPFWSLKTLGYCDAIHK